MNQRFSDAVVINGDEFPVVVGAEMDRGGPVIVMSSVRLPVDVDARASNGVVTLRCDGTERSVVRVGGWPMMPDLRFRYDLDLAD
jgi:hypothetical protein